MQTFEAIYTANEQQPDASHIGTFTLPGRSPRSPYPSVGDQIQEDNDEHAEDQQKYYFAGQLAGREVQIHRNPRILAGCDRRQTARGFTSSNQCCYTPAVKFFASRRMSPKKAPRLFLACPCSGATTSRSPRY
jgi:hypothetical protein